MLLAAITAVTLGHNSMIIPTPRNAVDGMVPAMKHGGTVPGGLTCTCANSRDCPMGNARQVGGAGQPCLWWSQGCSIGCPYCLTDPKHEANNGTIPTTPITGNAPHADKAGFRKSYCKNPTTQSVLPKEYWTMNTHAVDGAVNDSYRFNPWRAPGVWLVVPPALPRLSLFPFPLSLSRARSSAPFPGQPTQTVCCFCGWSSAVSLCSLICSACTSSSAPLHRIRTRD